MQNNFGRYLSMVMDGFEVVAAKYGREFGRFLPKDTAASYVTDSLAGIMKENAEWRKS